MIWLASSLAVGVVVRPLTPDSSEAASESESLASLTGSLGQGITLAALGGYRNVAANFVWISMYGDWQYRRKSEVLEKMRLAVSLNPDSLYFWIDGSRIIANDMPVWQVGDDFMESLFREGESVGVRKEFGEKALSFLDDAPERIAVQIPLLVEKGAICWRRLEDLDRALVYFERAVVQPEVPYYVCRVYAELLYRNGNVREAWEYLREHYETLPDNELSAMKPVVFSRIQELEKELSAAD
ncbi:hypothetical protein VDG1235_4508 [Verrucomicrobiia bacterium DG1235]|nr:hypothetical protein VDG1235_4508 [Verrucomicrobiae bacterium DG1235]